MSLFGYLWLGLYIFFMLYDTINNYFKYPTMHREYFKRNLKANVLMAFIYALPIRLLIWLLWV